MAVFDRIKTTTTSTTSPFVVSTTPPTGYLGFSKFANGATDIPVAIVHQTANEWQVCYCSWNSATNQLTVTSVLLSTNNDSAVTFSAGTKDVFVTGSSRSLGHLREINTWTANNYFNGGNVGIGTPTPFKPLHVDAPGTGTTGNGLAPGIRIDNSDLTSAGTVAVTFGAYDPGGTPRHAATIVAGKDGAWVAGSNYPSNLQFWTRPNSTADQIERMRIDTNGNVGIGLTSLAANTKLHIRDDTQPTNETRAIVQITDQRLVLAARWQSGVEQYAYIASTSDTGAGTDFRIRTGSTDRFSVRASDGNVGIGTTSPGYRLHVAGTGYFSDTVRFGANAHGNVASDATQIFVRGDNIAFQNSASSTTYAYINSSGNVGIGTTGPSCRFHVRHDTTGGNPATSGTTDTGMIHRINNNVVGLDTGVLTNGSTWIQNRNTTDFSVNYPILLNPNGGNVGIGSVSAEARLDVRTSSGDCIITNRGQNAAYFMLYGTGFPTFNQVQSRDGAGNLYWAIGGNGAANTLQFMVNGNVERMRIDSNGNVGMGTTPVANGSAVKLWVAGDISMPTTNRTILWNGYFNSTSGQWNYSGNGYIFALRENGGGKLEFFTSGNNTGGAGAVAVLSTLMSLDATAAAPGNVGIGTASPQAKLHVLQGASSFSFLASGSVRGVRIFHDSTVSIIEGVDHTGNTSYQPLHIGGSYVAMTASGSERARFWGSGGVSIGNTADPGASTLRLGRQNAGSEGAQIEFCRASDNEVGWYIDLIGSGTGTDPTTMRWIDHRASIPVSRLELNSRGVLSITNDLGTVSTETNAVGFRGSPNEDLTSDRNLNGTDAGKTVRKTNTTARDVFLRPDSGYNFPIGTCIMLCNVVDGTGTIGGNNLRVRPDVGVTISFLSGMGTKTNRTSPNSVTIAYGGSATLRKVAANLWTITGSGVS